MPNMYRTLLCVVILSVAIPAMAQTNCAELIEKATYPPLARQALIQGDVKAHFDVGDDRKPINLVVEGHPLLKETVEAAINKTRFAADCRGSLDLIYRFVISIEISQERHTHLLLSKPLINFL
jgi:outer membrane biosynthesis protein TonB